MYRHKINDKYFLIDLKIAPKTDDAMSWVEYEIPVPWGKVAGKWWGPQNRQPILCLHGWQDNAGTHDRLIPLLPTQFSYLSIDLPGHGKSSHYPNGMQYYVFWDGIALIRRLVKIYKWEKIVLIGHSLGGCLSFMYASCFPDDVDRFVSIDIAGPTVRNFDRIASNTGDAIDKFLHYETLPKTKMPCYEYKDMIDLVVDAYQGSVDRLSVEVLMTRGMAIAPKDLHKNGYHFARDLRLKVSVMGMFSLEQVLAYARRIKCAVLNIRGIPGMTFDDPGVYPAVIEEIRKSSRRLVYEEVEGTHHLHLVTPERVSGIISKFLLDKC